MKKTYIKPTTVEIAINSELMQNIGSMHINADGGTAIPFEEDAEGESLSRGFSWDDED